jgi:hypothetical protein
MVNELLKIDPFMADARTYATRAPGMATPLMLLGEADMTTLDARCVRQVATKLVEHMSIESLTQANTKGNNVFHLAASRGNKDFMETVLQACADKMGTKLSEALDATNRNGKSVKDVAAYNRAIREIVHEFGGSNVSAAPADWATPLPADHKWQRHNRRHT